MFGRMSLDRSLLLRVGLLWRYRLCSLQVSSLYLGYIISSGGFIQNSDGENRRNGNLFSHFGLNIPQDEGWKHYYNQVRDDVDDSVGVVNDILWEETPSVWFPTAGVQGSSCLLGCCIYRAKSPTDSVFDTGMRERTLLQCPK